MADLTVDASVWVAAADPRDAFHAESEAFLAAIEPQGLRIVVPAFTRIEVACALAHRLQSPAQGRPLSEQVMALSVIVYVPVDDDLLQEAWRTGTGQRLRGADALCAATAQLTGAQLISWDNELVQRAGALTPTAWLDADP
jgi:predicted nucleic acid-binding protein